ncbi:MAG: translation initiation factor [Flavobacteriaceae bacterium]
MGKKKKLGGFSELGGFVFSTNDDFKPEENQENESLKPNEQLLEAHFSNKGRGGKTVTLIKGFEGSNEERKALCKLLKNQCGVGGSVKDEDIIIQGKVRDKIIEILKKEGYRVKRVGG